MDAFVRRYIHENLCYRFVMLPDGAAAYAVEAAIKGGVWGHGRPLPRERSQWHPCLIRLHIFISMPIDGNT
jgi:hypothetical protein